MDKTKQESDYFYIWKALACTLVVFIHCPFPGAARWILTAVARIGVPFFFSVSGWYLFRTDDSEQQVEQLKGKIKKTAHMLLRVGAAYTLFAVIVELSVGTFIPEWLSEKFSISEILKLLVYNSNSLVDSYAWHLWWLFAMLNCYVVLYCWKKLCKDFNLEKYGNKIGIVLLAVMLILQAVVPQKLAWYRNWLFEGMPFILIGIYAQKNRLPAMFKLPTAFWLVMSVLEAHAFGKKEIYFSTVLAVLSILNRGHFTSFAWMSERLKKVLVHIGRELSAEVYCYHLMIYTTLIFQIHIDGDVWGVCRTFLVLGLSMLLAELLYRTKVKTHKKQLV